MQHKSQVRYPAPSDVVIRMFTDKAFHTRKLDAMGLKNYQVLDHALVGADFRIRIQRKVPMQAPALVKKIVPAESTVVNEERWNTKSKTGRVVVEPQGMPLEMSCVTALKDQGGECIVSYDWTIKAKIPLVGGALEKFVVSDLERRSAEETEIAIRMLKDYR
ncbi:MAG: hypothetical protein JWR07_4994 [Nevskia sp.]|nr:hypothetical protein [Nevskia sp.]